MVGRRFAATVLSVCGLGAMAAGWALVSGPQSQLRDAGALPPVQGPAVAGDGAPASPPQSIRGPGRFEAALVPVAAAADGALALPEEPGTGGWWALGAAPGASRGTVLVAGHVDTRESGPGAFAALHELALGARVVLTGADGRAHTYRITARRSYRQEALPGDLFDSGGAPGLALVTCAGRYDHATGRYENNLVLYGTPTSSAPPSPSRHLRRDHHADRGRTRRAQPPPAGTEPPPTALSAVPGPLLTRNARPPVSRDTGRDRVTEVSSPRRRCSVARKPPPRARP